MLSQTATICSYTTQRIFFAHSHDQKVPHDPTTSYYFMDDSVQGNIIRLLYDMRISPCMDDAIKTELNTSLFVPVGRRYIDLKHWAIDGRISNEDYDFWKPLQITMGYCSDPITTESSQHSSFVKSRNAKNECSMAGVTT